MPSLRLVLGDQLTPGLSSLRDADKKSDVILMGEVASEATYVRHHVKKIAFLFSAMRHFAGELEASGFTVRYLKIEAKNNPGSLFGAVEAALKAKKFDRVIVTEPGEYRLMAEMGEWEERLGLPVEIRPDDRFLASHEDFEQWAEGRKTLRMEYFYREMRKKSGLLMTAEGEPEGGAWNFDAENRKSLPKSLVLPERFWVEPDDITSDVLKTVAKRFDNHFGTLEPFHWGVTGDHAQAALDHFVDDCLLNFGDYQDAMAKGEPFLFHALISLYLNAGLLDPVAVCRRAEAAYYEGSAPLNAVEGFIRQIIGWREYIRGIYWLEMPDYKETNYFEADRPLPDFYWSGETDMVCMAEAIGQTRDHAYAHHIQRLMVTGNFALLAGLSPAEVNEWYLVVYADAYEWVELPNTHGMALFADGGRLASKPYAASGKYIDRMSDYCKSCRYSLKARSGEEACPFNVLYWGFLMDHEDKLRSNRRMGMIYRNLDRMDDTEKASIQETRDVFFKSIGIA